MRYGVELELKNLIIETDYRRKFLSFFKKAFEEYSQEIKEKFYDTNKQKEFTFSVYLPVEKINKDEIRLKNNKIKLFISMYQMEDALHFMNTILGTINRQYPFGKENFIKPIKIYTIQEKEVRNESVIFNTLSPIVIREKENQWYHEFDEKGIEILKKNTIFNLKEKFPEKYLNEIQFIPLETKKIIVNFYNIKFPVTKGVIKVEGKKEILDYLYKTGIGSKSSAGFGMCEVIE
ncbi:MAG: CRISPR-associated endoribonuclease Cas6 [Fusobacteriaceae bacterium]|nr:CRISPR-associated endoribonuclease Cas6 [Fusobacteriaceae bacterium]